MDETRLRQMATRLCEDFQSFGVSFESIELGPLRLLDENGQWYEKRTGPALIWHHRPDSAQRILLMIHYDTVYSASSSLPCVLRDTRLQGPGTADAKGGIAVIAMAIEAAIRFDLIDDLGVSILLNPDEEIGSTASAPLMQILAPQFQSALLFEPTLPNGNLVAARKGSGAFAMVVKGRSAHAGRNPEQGRNAIVHLSRIIARIDTLNRDDGTVLVNVGKILGGGPLNRVPDHAVAHINVRVSNDDARQQMEDNLKELVEQYSLNGFQVYMNGEFHSPPKCVDDQFLAVQKGVEEAGQQVGRPIFWQDSGGACDGCKFAAMGLPNVDTMGLTGDFLHSSDEYCDITTMVPAAATVLAYITQPKIDGEK